MDRKLKYTCRFTVKVSIRLVFLLLLPAVTFAQQNHYWSQNFNDESSLLSGAVVGGGAGPSSIYYNPATISEIKASKLSLNASLYSFNFLTAKDALGDGIDLKAIKSSAIPRFVSYILKPRNQPKWSLELAFMNLSDLTVQTEKYVHKNIDILQETEGVEDYQAFYRFSTIQRDDWVGLGASYAFNERLSVGASTFISFYSQKFYSNLEIDATPDRSNISDAYYFASYENEVAAKFNDYRMLWKFGLLYKTDRLSLGLNLSTPALSGVYSDGKSVMRRRSQRNITDPQTGIPMDDFLFMDFEEKKKVNVVTKSPFSIAAGLTWSNVENSRTIYLTAQYFFGIQPYETVKANRIPFIGNSLSLSEEEYQYWLTFVNGAKPVFNVAVGSRWHLKKNLMLLTGFRTDFNYMLNLDMAPYSPELSIASIDYNKFHFTFGSTLNIWGQDITAGIQYTFGYRQNQKQLANLSDPVEFNYDGRKALQGTQLNTMTSVYNSLSLYLAATFNFTGDKKKALSGEE